MKPKHWDSFLNYLDIIEKNTKRVLRSDAILFSDDFLDRDLRDFRDDIDRKFQAEMMHEVLKTLTDRERKVIILRFGLIDDSPLNLDECGELLNITKERVRQLEGKALRKLRHPLRKKMMFCPLEWKDIHKKIIQEQLEMDELFEKDKQVKEAEAKKKREIYEKWLSDGGREIEAKRQKEANQRYWQELKTKRNEDALASLELGKAQQIEYFRLQEAKCLQALDEERIKRHNEIYEKIRAEEDKYFQALEQQKQERKRKEIEQEELKNEMKFMKNVAFQLINQVREHQKKLSELRVVRFDMETNENTAYIWDSKKKEKRFLNKHK